MLLTQAEIGYSCLDLDLKICFVTINVPPPLSIWEVRCHAVVVHTVKEQPRARFHMLTLQQMSQTQKGQPYSIRIDLTQTAKSIRTQLRVKCTILEQESLILEETNFKSGVILPV